MPNSLVAVVMGSTSDWPVMQHATECLEQFGIDFEAKVVSAHRTPDLLAEFGKQARANGCQRVCLHHRRRRRCCALAGYARG